MPRVFISYVHENTDEVQRLANELKAHGIKVWLDKNQIKPGSRWKDAIKEAISLGDFFIACFSDQYSSRSKTYMNEELILAIEELRQRPTDRAWFIPVLLSPTEVPNRDIGAGETLRSIQWVQLYNNWDDGMLRILSVIEPDAVRFPQVDLPRLTEKDWALLIHHIAEGRCTPFIGPGCCVGVLPYDTTLAREWALKYGYDLDDSLDIAKVAQFLTRTDPMLPKMLIQQRFHNVPPPFLELDEPHAVLAALPFSIYMTANYDDFMEQALKARNKVPKSDFTRWQDNLRNVASTIDYYGEGGPTIKSPVVFHFYGYTEVPESIVITEDDTDEFLAASRLESWLPLRIRRALTGASPLFLGFSLSDPRYRKLFNCLKPHLDINLYRVFALTEKLRYGTSEVREYIESYFPHLTGGSNCPTLRDFMAELRSRWEDFCGARSS